MMIENEPDDRSAQEGSPGEADEAVDMLAFLLRALGEHGFDTANTRAEEAKTDLDAWARHLLVGSAPPGVTGAPASDRTTDWKGLRLYTSEKRRDEAAYVIQSTSDLRETLWTFIQGMAHAIPQDRSSDEAVFGQVEKLRACLDSSDTSELRRVANASIGIIDNEIRGRIERNQRRVEDLADQVKQVSDELMEAREKLELDSLTGLFNRGAFDQYIAKMAHLGMLSGQSSTLMMIDIDDFKWVNDHYGHPVGDEVLKEVASALLASFARRGDFVARYGGDEFAVIIQTLSEEIDRESGEAALHRVRDLSVPSGEETVRVTLSMGASRLRCGEGSPDWLARSDRALYGAKEGGRDRFVCESELEEQRAR